MKTTKVLLSSFALAGLLAACTNEEFTEPVQKGDALAGRTQVNLTLADAAVGTRMGINGAGSPTFTRNDVLGAVLVDGGYVDETSAAKAAEEDIIFNNVKWNVVDGHVGNNKWAYDAATGKFRTQGTTAVGAWLFYTKYNEKMTTTRNGVEFDFPQIQEGAATLEQAENNNINFKITPVLYIDGYEGETMDLGLVYASVFSELNIKLAFNPTLGVTKVQKIVVSAKDGENSVNFPLKYKINNKKVPVASLSLNPSAPDGVKVSDMNGDEMLNKLDQDAEIERAYARLRYSTDKEKGGTFEWGNVDNNFTYKNVAETRDESVFVNELVLDCNSNHDDTSADQSLKVQTDGRFSVYMLMPTGVYSEISLDIYTDKGIYTKKVTCRDEYVANEMDKKPSKKGGIFLRPNFVVSLADVERVGNTKPINDFLPVTKGDLKKEGKQYITKTADLINFINAIATIGPHEVNVLTQSQIGEENGTDDEPIKAHSVVINQEVMDAINAKENELGGDIQLTFIGAKMTIKGNQTESRRLDIHDLTFKDGCEVTEGYVKTTEDIAVLNETNVSATTEMTMYVNSGADVEFGHVYSKEAKNKIVTKVEVLNGGKVAVAEEKNITITEILNKGTIVIAGELNVTTLNNNAGVTNNGTVNVNGGYNRGGIISNTGNWTVKGEYNNEKTTAFPIKQGVINNSGKLIVDGMGNTASLNNKATVNNSGDMYCHNGNNTINNVGVINVTGEGSSYITTNSGVDELTNTTNADNVVLGIVTVENRDQDVSVTTGTQKGYIEYAVKNEDLDDDNTLKWMDGDKYNRVVLNSSAVVLDETLNGKLRYVIDNGCTKLKLAENLNLQELTFNTDATLNTANSKVAKLTVADGKTVKVPTEKTLYVVDVTTETYSKTTAEFENNGTILVGGDLYTSISDAEAANQGTFKGIFASGDGNETAFHWGEAQPSTGGSSQGGK